ncbi:elongation of very long chain fatty acids protein 6-like [Oppia nitens]|uniref:elongation of very long chain fatty acids protein 6-like n=1 Tax=Oppia nitens TaxID=1686743 RepID=UPI0023DA4153|nr:elongation of very long chain fatty acids protein 6-like [Oppia nitens]
MDSDFRYNYYNLDSIDSVHHWSSNWDQLPGLSYIPVITELEDYLFDVLPAPVILKWLHRNFFITFYISIGYLLTILLLSYWMSYCEKSYKLRSLLILWNILNAIFSIIATIRMVPNFVYQYKHKGLVATYCQSDYYRDYRLVLWYSLFCLSKIPELLDTVFIILRRSKLIKLHWIHHSLTLLYAYYLFMDIPGTAQWSFGLNVIVHSVMYTYYALMIMKLPLPRQVSMLITTMQIIQMILGLIINMHVLWRKLNQSQCDCSIQRVLVSLFIYTLFLALFLNYFYKTYIVKKRKVN